MRNIEFTPRAWADYEYWESQDKKTLKKIKQLLRELQRHPESGTGHPEPLTANRSGEWSRKINQKDRVVYRFTDITVLIGQLRTHYE